jgi:23S rRNA pseudouridine2604 synthase
LPEDEVTFMGIKVGGKQKPVLLLVNKPIGIVSTAEKREKNNIVDFINYPTRLYPVGRLDKDSHGLILMTNIGEVMDKILKAKNNHEKEYIVKVNKPVTSDFVEKMSKGVYLKDLDKTTRLCQVEKISKFEFKIVLMQVVKRITAPMSNEIITLVKDTSLARVIMVPEMLKAAERFTMTGLIWPLFYTGVFFLIFSGLLTLLFRFIEKKLDYYKI